MFIQIEMISSSRNTLSERKGNLHKYQNPPAAARSVKKHRTTVVDYVVEILFMAGQAFYILFQIYLLLKMALKKI